MQYLPRDVFDKKSYMSFRLVPKSVTLNDLERQNGPYFALFLPNLVVALILHYFGDAEFAGVENARVENAAP